MEAEAGVFLGLPRGQAGTGEGGSGGTLQGGRPRRGGSAGFSSSEVIAGFNLCTETPSTRLPTWRRKVLWDQLRTV